MEGFINNGGFCSDCGSILPEIRHSGDLTCYSCYKVYPPKVLLDVCTTRYTIHFNSRLSNMPSSADKKTDGEEGPIVERKCPKCDNDRMSYAALQLRSADEGQTVFYTCTKCKFKESENS